MTDWLLKPMKTWLKKNEHRKVLEDGSDGKVLDGIARRGVDKMSDFANIITTYSQ